ncbi:Kinase, CAMK CAMKL [Spironucleus salmonicida]|uniref:non-specific serine/threonine protein kinase n=1 Tax=Spironucleus salmonicida TaxID=348837 RepID=V6LCL5_9EUKA|nr:Kinase, CAMK CAMKL [Spironucleus salmonicida]|eukprot:EST41998.1 Kinase, CAMK CAMKL [Spironucleus salmonicida]
MTQRYRVISTIGAGAFGTTHLIQSIETEKLYCLKKIRASAMSKYNQAQIQNEVKIMKQLQHPHIVKFYDSQLINDHIQIRMSYAQNGDFASKKIYSDQEITFYLAQLLLGLDYLHITSKVIHRDIKPQNLLLDDKTLQICDFGLSKLLHYTNALARTQCGTPYYYSPEIASGKVYTQKADIWSCGIVGFRMVYQRLPFTGKSMETLMSEIAKFKFSDNEKTSRFYPILSKMLQVDQFKRSTAREILAMAEFRETLAFLCKKFKKQKAYLGQIQNILSVCSDIQVVLNDDLVVLKTRLIDLLGEMRFYQILIGLSKGQVLSQCGAGLSIQAKSEVRAYVKAILACIQ